jgi:hypothetical protein
MIGRGNLKPALVALWCLAAAGCAKVTYEMPQDAALAKEVPPVAERASVPSAVPGVDSDTSNPPLAAPAAELSDRIRDSVDGSAAANEVQVAPLEVAEDLPLDAPGRSIAVAEAPPTQAPERAAEPIASVALPAVETLDFTSLVTRLRKTKAINLRTKVAVKNESDDLLEQFRAYHAQHGTATLAELRQSYDSLLFKLHSLLEDADPPLAEDIGRSRAAIWAILADPTTFGATAPSASTRSVPTA